jgi:hypothetical protein
MSTLPPNDPGVCDEDIGEVGVVELEAVPELDWGDAAL